MTQKTLKMGGVGTEQVVGAYLPYSTLGLGVSYKKPKKPSKPRPSGLLRSNTAPQKPLDWFTTAKRTPRGTPNWLPGKAPGELPTYAVKGHRVKIKAKHGPMKSK